jgi:hypothetical protein
MDSTKELMERRIFKIDKNWVRDDNLPDIIRGVQAVRLYDYHEYVEKEYFTGAR